jgi:hypothetical protein
MDNELHKAVHVALKFADQRRAHPVMRELEQNRSVAVHLLRGRVAPEESWFELEVTGAASRVDALIRLTARLGAAIHPLPPLASTA